MEDKRINLIYITSNILETDKYKQELAKDSCGSILVFEGVTREYTEGQKVTKLEYECYEPMAKLMLEEINAIKMLINKPKELITCIIGGSKISTKIGVLNNLVRSLKFCPSM